MMLYQLPKISRYLDAHQLREALWLEGGGGGGYV